MSLSSNPMGKISPTTEVHCANNYSLSSAWKRFKWFRFKALVIRQKGKFQNGCFKKIKHVKFSEKRTFLTPWYAQIYLRIRGQEIFVFLQNLACFFLKQPFWDSPFCLITDEMLDKFNFKNKSSISSQRSQWLLGNAENRTDKKKLPAFQNTT